MRAAVIGRISYLAAIVRGVSWRALLAIPFGALSGAAFLRDELLDDGERARWKMLSLLPDWT